MEQEALDARDIQSMSEGLVQAKMVMDFRLLHDFIIVFLLTSKALTGKDSTAVPLVKYAYKHAAKMYGWTVARTTISTRGFSTYLVAEIKRHQEFLDSAALCATHARRADQEGIARYLQGEVVEFEAHVKRLEDLQSTLPDVQAEG